MSDEPRPPANDIEAERFTLGSMMWSEHNIAEAVELVEPEDFYRPVHATIYRTILQLQTEGVIPDTYAVHKRLIENGDYKQLPEITYISDLSAGVPTTVGNTAYYATKVGEAADTRRHEILAVRLQQATQIADPGQRETAYANVLLEMAEINGTGKAKSKGIPLSLNWAEIFSDSARDVDWLVEPLIERGQLVALFSEPKAGKSLLVQEIAGKLAAGLPALDNPARTPIKVIYCDMENTDRDLRERYMAFGFTPDELDNLVYLSFPPFAPLNTAVGAAQLVATVTHHAAELVILDTAARFVEGPENDADTWNELYRLALVPLKAAGVAVVRLDHQGKDPTKGQRGSSAKGGDVDAVWRLESNAAGTERILTLEMGRTNHGVRRVSLKVDFEPLRHTVRSGGELAAAADAATAAELSDRAARALGKEMDELGVGRSARLQETSILAALEMLERLPGVKPTDSQRAAWLATEQVNRYNLDMPGERPTFGKHPVQKAQEIRQKRASRVSRTVRDVSKSEGVSVPQLAGHPESVPQPDGTRGTRDVSEESLGRSDGVEDMSRRFAGHAGHQEPRLPGDGVSRTPPPPQSGGGAGRPSAGRIEKEEQHPCKMCFGVALGANELCDNCGKEEG